MGLSAQESRSWSPGRLEIKTQLGPRALENKEVSTRAQTSDMLPGAYGIPRPSPGSSGAATSYRRRVSDFNGLVGAQTCPGILTSSKLALSAGFSVPLHHRNEGSADSCLGIGRHLHDRGSADSASASVVTITTRALHILVSGGSVVLQQSCPQDPFSFWLLSYKIYRFGGLGTGRHYSRGRISAGFCAAPAFAMLLKDAAPHGPSSSST